MKGRFDGFAGVVRGLDSYVAPVLRVSRLYVPLVVSRLVTLQELMELPKGPAASKASRLRAGPYEGKSSPE